MGKRICTVVLNCSIAALVPGIAAAAGTYYSGNYNSPQRNYATSGYANRNQNVASYSNDTTYTRTRTVTQNDNAYIGQPYNGYTRVVGSQQQTNSQTKTTMNATGSNVQRTNGFWLGGGLAHEFASWNFDMKQAGSKLHYDNVRWNVLDINAGYRFGGNTRMQIDAGFKYGMQFGDSSMVDDDITNGGYVVTEWVNSGTGEYIGAQMGNSLSIGNSSSGNMMGFNAGFGFTDLIKLGGARLTPSVGFRYLKYKLETKHDYGLTIDTGPCSGTSAGGDEVQCDPILIFFDGTSQQVMWDYEDGVLGDDGYWYWLVPNAQYVTTAGTYKFELPSISHSYETTWMGPYLALDLDYEIDRYNLVNARFELGLPLYNSTGDQPYRSDWQHPKSVEDKGGFGDAWHIGLGANYMTALSDTVALTVGFTFDYYTMSGGEANTYLNKKYYTDLYDYQLELAMANNPGMTASEAEAWMLANDPVVQNIVEIERECSGWVCKVDNEIESIYKSIGIHIGIQAKF